MASFCSVSSCICSEASLRSIAHKYNLPRVCNLREGDNGSVSQMFGQPRLLSGYLYLLRLIIQSRNIRGYLILVLCNVVVYDLRYYNADAVPVHEHGGQLTSWQGVDDAPQPTTICFCSFSDT